MQMKEDEGSDKREGKSEDNDIDDVDSDGGGDMFVPVQMQRKADRRKKKGGK